MSSFKLAIGLLVLNSISMMANAATITADDEGNIVASVASGSKVLFQEGDGVPVDLVGEATLAQEGIKLARRETSENRACDETVTEYGVKVASTVADVATFVKTSIEKQNEMIGMLAAMVNNTANAAAASTTSKPTGNSVAEQIQARQMTIRSSCMEYKLADPTVKSGVFILDTSSIGGWNTMFEMDQPSTGRYPFGDDATHYVGAGNPTTVSTPIKSERRMLVASQRMIKVFCDMETDGGGLGGYCQYANRDAECFGPFNDQGDQKYGIRSPSQNPKGRSFKFADKVINAIRTKLNPKSSVGYRITSNDNAVTFFGHEECTYYSKTNPSIQNDKMHKTHPCRRYTTQIDAGEDDWMQCQYWVPDLGGFDCWYACRNPSKEHINDGYAKGWTPVFMTDHEFEYPDRRSTEFRPNGGTKRQTAMNPTNVEGKSAGCREDLKHDASETCGQKIKGKDLSPQQIRNSDQDSPTPGLEDDVLMWVR